MEKTITITLTLPDNIDTDAVLNAIKEFDQYNESMGVGSEHETNSEELRGSMPKPRRPKQN